MENIKQRLFVDIDGTLAVFTPVDNIETLYEKGYFLNLKPLVNVLDAIKIIKYAYPKVEIFVLSSALSDSKYAIEEKNAWLDKHLPQVDKLHRLFLPCGASKRNYVPNGITGNDYLLDDYTVNLKEWASPSKAIKLLNGINSTNGTWQHNSLRYDKSPPELAKNITEIMTGKKIQDEKPTINKVTSNYKK